MLQIAPQSRPPFAVEVAARGLASVAGALPFAEAIKGKVSEDPDVEDQFLGESRVFSLVDGEKRQELILLSAFILSSLHSRPANLPRQASHRDGLSSAEGVLSPSSSLCPVLLPLGDDADFSS